VAGVMITTENGAYLENGHCQRKAYTLGQPCKHRAAARIIERYNFFKGAEQRKLGHMASFIVWASLAFNTIAMFASSAIGEMPGPLPFYVRYVLPLSIVCVPHLWKWLLDLHPDSQKRIATLEAHAEYNAQWRQIQRDQNEQVISAYRGGIGAVVLADLAQVEADAKTHQDKDAQRRILFAVERLRQIAQADLSPASLAKLPQIGSILEGTTNTADSLHY